MISTADLHWAAGFLEGEGSFPTRKKGISVAASQVQRWPLDRLIEIFGGALTPVPRKILNPKWQDAHMWWVSGERAVGVMMTLYVLLSPRRREQIGRALTAWKARRPLSRMRYTCPKGHTYSSTRIDPRTGLRRLCGVCIRLNRREYYHSRIAAGNPIGGRPVPAYRKRRSTVPGVL